MAHTFNTTLRAAFEKPDTRIFSLTNDALAFLTLLSVFALVLETSAAFSEYHTYFKLIEYISVGIFSLEYIARVVTAKSKSGYIFSFFGIIDLLAILPTLLALTNLTFLKSARSLRILRFLRMLRLAKLARVHSKKGAHDLYTINVQIYVVAFLSALLFLGTLLFIVEGQHAHAKDIPTSMFWAFKVILGGIPFEQPHSSVGLAILIATKFVSLILFGLLLNLVNTLMRKVLTGSETDA